MKNESMLDAWRKFGKAAHELKMEILKALRIDKVNDWLRKQLIDSSKK